MIQPKPFKIIVALSLLISACTTTPAASSTLPPTATVTLPTATTAPTSTPEAAAYPQTYTDALKRTVTIAVKPQRIVSLAPSVTEILFAIGAGPQMVGRTTFCNYPPEATALPTIGGFSAKSISVEAILELQPDLVVAGSLRQKDVVAALEGQGIPVYTLAPTSLAEIQTGITTMGNITGNAEGATKVLTDMQSRMGVVAAKVKDLPEAQRPKVFYEVFDEPLTTASNATVIGELLTLAGGTNIFADLTETYPTVSVEQIADLDPQFIIGPSGQAEKLTPELVAARPGWGNLTAVKNKGVYIVNEDLISRSGPRIVDGLEALAKIIHPELFGQ